MIKNVTIFFFIIVLMTIYSSCDIKKKKENKIESADTTVYHNPIIKEADSTVVKEISHISKDTISSRREGAFKTIESKIVFDKDFKPSIYLKIRNNATFSIVGLRLMIRPWRPLEGNSSQEECNIILQKSITISPAKVGLIKESIQSPEDSKCTYDNGSIQIIGMVYSNGEKIAPIELLRGN